MKEVKMDFNVESADWIKQSWPFAPYRSKEFMEMLKRLGVTLKHFKSLPVYKRAVERGLIINDEWRG